MSVRADALTFRSAMSAPSHGKTVRAGAGFVLSERENFFRACETERSRLHKEAVQRRTVSETPPQWVSSGRRNVKLVPGKIRRVVRRVIGGDKGPNGSLHRPSPPPPVTPSVPDLDLAMIVGAQRSGTTWLQLLCAAHPKIAGGEELHLFSHYVGHIVHNYYEDLRKWTANKGVGQGLPSLLTPAEFDAAIKQFCTTTLSRLIHGKPGAELAIEKTPDHVLHLHYIRLLYPDVKVIHVIRDPRDVVESQLAAAASWGDGWAAKSVAEAAQRWVDWVSKGRAYGKDASKYIEVRYESLLNDGPRELARVYEFLGYPLPAEQVTQIYEGFKISNIKTNAAPRVLVKTRNGQSASVAPPAPAGAPPREAVSYAPPGFFRKGKAGGWRETMSEADVATVERIAGPLMCDLGYPPAALTPAPATDDAVPTVAAATG